VEFGELDPDLALVPIFAEVGSTLDELGKLHLPLVARFNAAMPVPVLEFAGEHPECSALWIANTGDQQTRLTGSERLAYTGEKVARAKVAGVKTPIIADGIRRRLDAFCLYMSGASGFAIGPTTLVWPWRRRQICRVARRLAALA